MRYFSFSMGLAAGLIVSLVSGCNDRAVGPDLGICGDGVVDLTEECDDGNTVGGDGCDETCRIDNCVPTVEVCNGEDDDCDGVADEDGICSCNDPLALTLIRTETVAGPGNAADPTLVWSGTEYGAVWSGGFARLDPAGRIQESKPSVSFLASEPADIVYSAAADRYLFCWSSQADVDCGSRGANMASTETANAVNRSSEGYAYNNPKITFNPAADRLAIVYPTEDSGATVFDLVLQNTSFSTLDGPVDVAEHPGQTIWHASVAWTDEHYAFVYVATDETLYLSLFSAAGTRLGPDMPVANLPYVEYFGNLLWDGVSFRVAWSDFGELFYLKFSPTGEIEAHNQVTQYGGTALVYSPVLALGPWPGLVWFDLGGSLDGSNVAYFTVVDDDGNPLRDPIVLSNQGIYPHLASNGETYVATWREGEDVWDPDIAFGTIGCP